MAGWIERMAQSVLQLERSREGLVWSRSAGADDKSFVECNTILQQRQYMCSALQNAQQEVRFMLSLRLPSGFCWCEHNTHVMDTIPSRPRHMLEEVYVHRKAAKSCLELS